MPMHGPQAPQLLAPQVTPLGSGAFTQPPGPQLSAVQGLPSSQPAGTQLPPQHISPPLHVSVR